MKYVQSPSIQKAWSLTNKRGFSLIEVILSAALLGLLATTFMGAYWHGHESSTLSGNRARASLLAEEGLEAVRNIRDGGQGLGHITDGTFGLSTTSNVWNLSGTSNASGIFTRQIVISSVDATTKMVTSNVTWQQNLQRTGQISLSTYLTNWQCAEQASFLGVNIASISLSNGSKNLNGITLQNTGTGCGDIRIDTITISWSPSTGNRRIESVSINGSSVWTGSAVSGSLLDITDTTLSGGAAALSTEFLFGASMVNRTFTMTFTMGDGSTKTVTGISP